MENVQSCLLKVGSRGKWSPLIEGKYFFNLCYLFMSLVSFRFIDLILEYTSCTYIWVFGFF